MRPRLESIVVTDAEKLKNKIVNIRFPCQAESSADTRKTKGNTRENQKCVVVFQWRNWKKHTRSVVKVLER